MSWPFIVLLACAVVVVIAAEWHRLGGRVTSTRFGTEARRTRERQRRKSNLKLVRSETEEFEAEPCSATSRLAASSRRPVLPVRTASDAPGASARALAGRMVKRARRMRVFGRIFATFSMLRDSW